MERIIEELKETSIAVLLLFEAYLHSFLSDLKDDWFKDRN